MGGNELPSIEELKGFKDQLGQLSPSEFRVQVSDDGVRAWNTQLSAAVRSLKDAAYKAPTGPVEAGGVLHPAYESATVTAKHLTDSGESVHANLMATLQAAEALQSFVQKAYALIDQQAGG